MRIQDPYMHLFCNVLAHAYFNLICRVTLLVISFPSFETPDLALLHV